MILVAGTLIIFATVPLLGGRLGRVGSIRFARIELLALALVLQIGVLQVASDSVPGRVAAVAHVLSYALAAGFVWRNRRIPGLSLIGIGGLANLLAIAANGGVMPASPEAYAAAGLDTSPGFANSVPFGDARLAWLGDVFHTPGWLPLANVFSIGDVLLLVGAAVLVHQVGGSRVALRLARVPARP